MTGAWTAELLAAGWYRNDLDADLLDPCGWIPESIDGGVCDRPARWEKAGARACAQHARMIEQRHRYERTEEQTMTDPHEVGVGRCARGHTFEDLRVAIEENGGWCPTCDAPARRKSNPDEHEVAPCGCSWDRKGQRIACCPAALLVPSECSEGPLGRPTRILRQAIREGRYDEADAAADRIRQGGTTP